MGRGKSSAGIRVPGQPGKTERTLEELQASRAEVCAAIAKRYKTLRELWRRAKPADRGLAIARLLREAGLPEDVHADVVTLEDAAEHAQASLRVARAQGETALARRLEVDATLAERARDEYLEQRALFEAVFAVGESFLIDVPYERGIEPLSTMLEQVKRIDAEIARVDKRRAAETRKRAPIRMLPALTMSGNIPIIRD